MNWLRNLLLLLGLIVAPLVATPVLAETIVVAEGDSEMTGTANTTYSGAYDVLHSDFYINSGSNWGVAELATNISATTSRNPAWVTIAVRKDLTSAASTAVWFSALTTHIAALRSAVSGVKIAVMTLPPNSDATYTSRRAVANGLIRAAEGVEIDKVIDFAAHPTMGPDTAVSDGNLFSANEPVACSTACTLVDNAAIPPSASLCYNTISLSGSKGQNYYTKQYACAMESLLAGKYPWTVYEMPVVFSVTAVVPSTDPPAYTLAAVDDVPTTVSTTGWTTASGTSYIPWVSGSAHEKKFRTIVNGTIAGRFDPVRAPGQTISGHCHLFFGKTDISGSSTYKSLRLDQGVTSSSAAGGVLNETGYWVPCPKMANAMGDGITRVKKIKYVILYYNASWGTNTGIPATWVLPRGMSYVFGTDMDDPTNIKAQAEILPYASRVTFKGNGWTGVLGGGWTCHSDSLGDLVTNKGGLTNTDGSDAMSACPSTYDLYAELRGPECWDGVNLRSANGYYHMRKAVQNSSSSQFVCADNWYGIPRVEEKIFFDHLTTTDYLTWICDSDAAAQALGASTRNCGSFHGDWFGAWDYPTMLKWMNFCTGSKTTSTDAFTANECDYSTITATERMISDSAAPFSGRNPQTSTTLDTDGSQASEWWDLPATSATTGAGFRSRGKLHKKQ